MHSFLQRKGTRQRTSHFRSTVTSFSSIKQLTCVFMSVFVFILSLSTLSNAQPTPLLTADFSHIQISSKLNIKDLNKKYLNLCTNLRDQPLRAVFPEDRICIEIFSDFSESDNSWFAGDVRFRGEVLDSYYELEIQDFQLAIPGFENQELTSFNDSSINTKLDVGHINQNGFMNYSFGEKTPSIQIFIDFKLKVFNSEPRPKFLATNRASILEKPTPMERSKTKTLFIDNRFTASCAHYIATVYCWGERFVIARALELPNFRQKLGASINRPDFDLHAKIIDYVYSFNEQSMFIILEGAEKPFRFDQKTAANLITQDILNQLNISNINQMTQLDFGLNNAKITFVFQSNKGTHCFVFENAKMKCLGPNTNRLLGLGGDYGDEFESTLLNIKDIPAITLGHANDEIIKVLATRSALCALLKSGFVKCWGQNMIGLIGEDNANINNISRAGAGLVDLPYMNLGPSRVKDIYSTDKFFNPTVCALFYNGNMKCWGSNSFNLLAQSTYIDERKNTDQDTPTFSLNNLESFDSIKLDRNPFFIKKISLNSSSICALTLNGKVKCWGKGSDESLILEDPQHRDYIDFQTQYRVTDIISYSSGHCALFEHNKIKCWGASGESVGLPANILSQIQNTYEAYQLDFIDLGAKPVTHLFSYYSTVCAILSEESIYCWGNKETDASQSPISEMLNVAPHKVADVFRNGAMGKLSALLSNGQIIGINNDFTTESNPQLISPIPTNLYDSFCAESIDSKLYCWNSEDYIIPDGRDFLQFP